jgi:ATP/maltotriose-dependent transcriptional regulator MalT
MSSVSHHEAVVELIAGDPATAERRLTDGYRRLAAMGEKALLATTAAYLAQAVHAQGRSAQADELCTESARLAPQEDVVTHVIWRSVRSRIRADQGRVQEAEALARQAVELAARTDALVEHGDALLALADALEHEQRIQESQTAARAALDLYDRKGALEMAHRAWDRLQTTSERR